MEDKLRDAALAVSSVEGENVLAELLGSLTSILGVEFAAMAVYVEPQRTKLRTLSRIVEGKLADNVSYPIFGTPCEKAIGRAFGFFPQGVQSMFSQDAPLRELAIEGYAAATVNDGSGAPVGLLSIMSRSALENASLIEAMLKIFSARIGAELERRQAESARRDYIERLRVSEEQYRSMFDAAIDALVLRDADFRIVDVNPAYLAATGFRLEDVMDVDLLTVIPHEEHARLIGLHRRAIAGEHVQFEAQAKAPDGRSAEVEVRGVPMTHQGRPHVLYVCRDITERKA
ncbi:MAG: PAS domain S-box protein, partial [Burkholderiales bacterium]